MCVRTFLRVHYERILRRRGVSWRNIDVTLKLNRIDDKNGVPHSAPHFLSTRFVRRRRCWRRLHARFRRARRCVFAQAYRVFFLVSSRGPGALTAGKSDPKARQTMRSPSEVPAAMRPVCGNIYTEVACMRPLPRPCTPLRGSRSLPRFLKSYRRIGSIIYIHYTFYPSIIETIVLNNVIEYRDR